MTREQYLLSVRNHRKAKKYFNLQKGYVLHHIDVTLKENDIERYIEWRPEDLQVMTIGEHNSLHKKGSHLSEQARKNIGEAMKKPKSEAWMIANRKAMIEKGYWKK